MSPTCKFHITDVVKYCYKNKQNRREVVYMSRKTGEEMAIEFSDFVNVSTNDKQEFANQVTNEHRYLQQEMFNAMMKCIENWAYAHDNGFYDARNEYAVKASKAMIEGLKEKGLW
ncbi:hypothetical protein PQE75_gp033 [Bacillus phage vB_BcoS-136]|uniref:Uncharacterized protein n=1 Tax=Bacillus phage vB_BcoS-136 TaxID=2419619 RepID=A0A3G3BVA0_9CAUD|nr:hypothetical protein PQE75_gp033 [Bacillus phage vB_BcoS-136]AYP68165.1 hypothetical protein vBBcoS136_00033 [Bacillus phage vB_BcoS-136]